MYIWKLQIIELEKHAIVSGIILRGKPHPIHIKENRLSIFFKIVASYFIKRYRNKKIRISGKGIDKEVVTNEEGEFLLQLPLSPLPDLRFYSVQNSSQIPVIQTYPRVFKNQETRYLLISDIDDTILISKSAKFISKLYLLLFKTVKNRKPVDATEKAYQQLSHPNISFAYVSGSEHNLFHLLSQFFMHNELPIGPLFLRPFVFWKDLLQAKKRKDYKMQRITRLMEYYPQKQVILFGDDSQQDYDVFHQLVEKYPQRIHSVFMRRTGFTDRFKKMADITKLPESQITLYYYNNYQQIQQAIENIKNEATINY